MVAPRARPRPPACGPSRHRSRTRTTESHVVLERPLLALVEVEVGDEVRRAVVTAGAEPVQVAVGPAHRGLDHIMQSRQGQVTGQLEAAPDRRPRTMQIQTHPEPAALARDRQQCRSLVALQPVEDAGHLSAHQRVEERLALLRAGTGHQLLHQMLDLGRIGHERQSIILDSRCRHVTTGLRESAGARLRGRRA